MDASGSGNEVYAFDNKSKVLWRKESFEVSVSKVSIVFKNKYPRRPQEEPETLMQDPCRKNLVERREREVSLLAHRFWHALG